MRPGFEQPLLLGDVLLEDVGLQGPVEAGDVGALALRGHEVHAEHGDRRSADGHGGGGLAERDPGEKHVHVGRGVDRDPAMTDLAERAGIVGVAAHQRGHVERDGQARTTRAQQHLVPLVRLPRVAEAGELPNGPCPAAVTGRIQPAGEGILTWPADPLEARITGAGRRTVYRVHGEPGQRGEVGVPLARRVVPLLPAAPAGFDDFGSASITAPVFAEIVGRPTTSFHQCTALAPWLPRTRAASSPYRRVAKVAAAGRPAEITRNHNGGNLVYGICPDGTGVIRAPARVTARRRPLAPTTAARDVVGLCDIR